MIIELHADDIGASIGITDSIMLMVKFADRNSLNAGVSVLANMEAFDYAMHDLKPFPNVNTSLHLNFIEGRPLAKTESVSHLVDSEGFFNQSFQSIWFQYLKGSKSVKDQLRQQISLEIREQLSALREALGENKEMRVDGHNHLHMIPFIMDEILKLKEEFNIQYVRVPYESFFVSLKSLSDLLNYFGLNLVKHLLLNMLSYWAFKKLKRCEVKNNQHFVGVLFTGNVSLHSIEKGLKVIFRQRSSRDSDAMTEVLLHPGKALPEERELWTHYPEMAGFYFSNARDLEITVATSPKLVNLLQSFA